MSKKIFSVLLTILATFLLIACNGNKEVKIEDVKVTDITITNELNQDENGKENYYLDRDEDYTINIYLENKNNREIVSVSIGGNTYNKEQFISNEDNTKLTINENTKSNFGVHELKVDKLFVNVDGKSLEAFNLNSKTINLSIKARFTPVIFIDEQIEGFDTFELLVYVEDRNVVIDYNNDGVYIEVYDEDILIDTQVLKINENNIEFDNLKLDHSYNYKVIAKYDIYDGNGIVEETIYEGVINTLAPFEINVLDEEETSIEFEYEKLFDVDVLEISLYKGDNKVKTLNENETLIDGLEKGTDYKINIDYKFEQNGETINKTQIKNVKTFELLYETLIRDGRPVRHPNGTDVLLPTYKRQKEEVRGIWISTVSNIDIGTMQGSNIQAYKDQLILMLDNIKEANFNTVFFQIRPMNDAFYPSELAPWSRYVTGREGRDPGFDILGFVIEEAHNRGLELHGWLNPYRVATTPGMFEGMDEENFAIKNPDLLLEKDGATILDPGKPEVQQYIRDVIMEIVVNYPTINGIHFDDYFYLSTFGENSSSPDYNTYLTYRKDSNQSIADFRRMSVTNMIEGIYNDIEEFNGKNNSFIKFGISPSGIWANKGTHPEGSSTKGYQHYSALYADTKHWIDEGIIHYIIPQIYWEFTLGAAPYAHLVDWWSEVVRGTDVDLVIGMGLYRYRENKWPTYELADQLRYNQMHDEVKGAVFFTYQDIVRSNPPKLKTVMDFIKENYWNKEAEVPWESNVK